MLGTRERREGVPVPFFGEAGFADVWDGFEASAARPFPSNPAAGFKSLIMRHTVQRKTPNCRGHLTVESHVLHLPVVRSFSALCA